MEAESHAMDQGLRVDPRASRAAEASESLVRMSPSNVPMPSLPMMVSAPASIRFAKQDQAHRQRFLELLFRLPLFRSRSLAIQSDGKIVVARPLFSQPGWF